MAPTDAINDDTRFVVPDHVLPRRAVGETVLLSLDSEEYYSLDAVGSRFWELIERDVTFATAVATLLEEFDVEREVLVTDLVELLDELRGANLVEVGS